MSGPEWRDPRFTPVEVFVATVCACLLLLFLVRGLLAWFGL